MSAPTSAAGPAVAVDWQQEVAALSRSSEWRQMLSELQQAAGGPSVAALLSWQAAAAEAAAEAAAAEAAAARQPPGAPTVSSGCGGTTHHIGSTTRLAEAVQQVTWEKLHCGDWHAVSVVWREAYAAACILAAAAGLPGSSSGGGGSQPAAATQVVAGTAAAGTAAATEAAAAAGDEAASISRALWHLDMACIMGGPLLRARVDGLIDRLQRRWQQLHAPSGGGAGAGGLSSRRQQQGEAEPSAKRQRVADLQAAAAAAAAAEGEAALLPPGSLGPRGSPVATAQLPSLETFWRDYMSTDTPVVISGAMEDWPALARWADPAYLVAVAGPRTVPVEVGEHYLADQWGQQLMTLQQFIERHILSSGGDKSGGGDNSSGGGAGGDNSSGGGAGGSGSAGGHGIAGGSGGIGAGASGCPGSACQQQPEQQQDGQASPQQQQQAEGRQRGYLAQHPLFDQIPALAADIREPPYCCLGEGEVQSINAWLGPAGTVTPLHTDPHPNLLCQAVGRKYVRLYSPAHTPAMYPHPHGMHTNTSQVDAAAPDLSCFPLFAEAPFQDCVLEAGQMLFIPSGWWHFVQSTTPSFSVSFWWR